MTFFHSARRKTLKSCADLSRHTYTGIGDTYLRTTFRSEGVAPRAVTKLVPLQNRVTPFGEIVAIPQRGIFTGNRGIIHDPATKTLLNKRWASKAWLICSCDYKGRRRAVMAGRSWTELFFLDEAVALAAGHRPCFVCRREAAERFRESWASSTGQLRPSAEVIDTVLHQERLAERGRKRIHPVAGPLSALPDGAMVAASGSAFTLFSGRAFRWTADGYGPAEELKHADGLLTPPSTLKTLSSGYRPILHPSIENVL
jgi:hypothetical protein